MPIMILALTGCDRNPRHRVLDYPEVGPNSKDRVRIAVAPEPFSPTVPELEFPTVPRIAVAPDGLLAVLDPGTLRILILDEDGAVRNTFAGRGGGPDRLEAPIDVATVGSTVLVASHLSPIIKTWTTGGSFLGEISPRFKRPTLSLHGLDDASMIRTFLYPPSSPDSLTTRIGVSRLWLDGEEQLIAEVFHRATGSLRFGNLLMPAYALEPLPRPVIGPDSSFFLNDPHKYSLSSFADGRRTWTITVDSPPRLFDPSAATDLSTAMAAEGLEPETSLLLPRYMPALCCLRSNEDGVLFVFPYTFADERRTRPYDRPVDLYTSEGEPILNGVIRLANSSWLASRGDHIFGTEANVSGDGAIRHILRRYRIELPALARRRSPED